MSIENDIRNTRTPHDSDAVVVDKVAALLGTSEEWDSSFLEDIANIIGTVRPHPGDAADTYVADFKAATGRNVPAGFDFTPDDNDDEGGFVR